MIPVENSPMIVNLAPTGAVSCSIKNPHVPVTERCIVENILAAAVAGASIIHLHVRDDEGMPCCSPQRYKSLLNAIRSETSGRSLVLCVSTSGRHGQTLEQRAAVLDLDGHAQPDMASLTLGSMNFARDVSINSTETIRFLAQRMLEKGIRPELEVFDVGMIHFAKELIREKLLSPPYYFNLILGNVAGVQPTVQDIAAIVQHLPKNSFWSLGGIGKSQKTAVGIGCIAAHGIRTGLEDNLWGYTDVRTPAKNIELVNWATNIAKAYGRPIASPLLTRQWLELPEK